MKQRLPLTFSLLSRHSAATADQRSAFPFIGHSFLAWLSLPKTGMRLALDYSKSGFKVLRGTAILR
jgi:hypothetical protein